MSNNQEKKQPAGVIVRGADGALYFLRDEVMEQCRMPLDVAKQAEKLMREPENFEGKFKVAHAPKLEVISRVEGSIGTPGAGFRANMNAMSTVMCPSFLFSRSESGGGDPEQEV
jgi:hypothetical protein